MVGGITIMMLEHPMHFFLGANSPAGFVSFYDEMTNQAENGRLFVVKGGPGTGKSTLMHRTAAALSQKEKNFEYIHCSSDPDSLDAVIFPKSGIMMADATPPHVIEPRYPGACETVVNLCACWDEEHLQSRRPEILALCKQNALCHQQCVRFLSAAQSLLADNRSTAINCLDTRKVAKTAVGIVARECRRRKRGSSVEKKRLLSAITPKGNLGFPETVAAMCPRMYLIKDPYGAASSLLLAAIRSQLMEYGLTIYTCFCPLSPHQKIDHILVPELGLAFVTAGKAFPVEQLPEPYRVISFTRFTDMEQLAARKQRLRFNRRAAEELLDAAVRTLRRAKSLHDLIEKEYGAAMDYSQLEGVQDVVLQQASFWQDEKLRTK